MTNNRTYSEMAALDTFQQKYEYLRLDGTVGEDTFGYDRYLNQRFYRSAQWKRLRNHIIVRDNACDLADLDWPIQDAILIHHINPITKFDIVNNTNKLLDPENLVCVTKDTHDAIHYGRLRVVKPDYVPRTAGDTKLW